MVISSETANRRLNVRFAMIAEKLRDPETSVRMRVHAKQVEIPQIEAARKRVADGTYGSCIACDEPIAARRLEAIPEVPLCMACERIRCLRWKE